MVKKSTDPIAVFAGEFIDLVKSGSFDGFLSAIDDAVTDRIATHNDESEKQAAKSTPTSDKTRTVPQPTRASSFVPDVDGTYVIADGVKNIGSKKVKFLRFRKDAKDKAVVEMLEDAPGAPKGKKIVVVVSALKKPVGRRQVVKKTATVKRTVVRKK